jgi:CoA-disulfide reductase
MANKVLIVGGVAGGASTAARLRRMDEEAEIIMFERGEYISFANCGLPYYIGGTIEEREKLLVQTPERMEARFEIDIRVKNEVIDIDSENQQVRVRDLAKGEEYSEDYDYLVLSPGAEAIKPPIDGIESDKIFTLRDIPDTDEIKGFLDEENPQKAVVVGGGFIGLEMVENLHNQGVDVSLVEMADQVMGPIDYEMASIVHNHMRNKGVNFYLEDGVNAFEDKEELTEVLLESGKRLEADMIILAIGVKANVELARKAELELGETGAILVNEHMQTSQENIYALGDAVEVKDQVTGVKVHIPLAGPANKQGRIVANNITGQEDKFTGTQGTSVAKVFDLSVASTGKNGKSLDQEEIDYEASFTISRSHAGYYPGSNPMTVKILFKPEDGELLGAQIVGRNGVDKRIDVLATSLRFKKTVFDLQELELAYAPPYSSAKDPVNMAGFAAGNILKGMTAILHWWELDEVDWEETILVDTRTESENRMGSIEKMEGIENSLNIPLSKLRDRLDELPKDKNIIVYCGSGVRSYIANRILFQNGFDNVRNLSGGYRLYTEIDQDKQARSEDGLKDKVEQGQIATDKTGEPLGEVINLNLCGEQCSDISEKLQQRIKELEANDILEVVVDGSGFRDDIESWCQETNNEIIGVTEKDNRFSIFIKKGE